MKWYDFVILSYPKTPKSSKSIKNESNISLISLGSDHELGSSFKKKRDDSIHSIVSQSTSSSVIRTKSQEYMLVHSEASHKDIAAQQKRKLHLLNDRYDSFEGHGAEKLATAITQLFAHLVEKIHDAGGDIIKFAGDALICIWSPENMVKSNIALGNLIYHAIHCGFELSTLVKSIKDEGTNKDINLGMHVSVGAGPVNMISIGGSSGRWEFLTTGRGYEDACNGVDLSKTGEMVVSNEAYIALTKELNKVSKLTGEVLHNSTKIEGTEYRRIIELSVPAISKLERLNFKEKYPNTIQALMSYLPFPVSQSLKNSQQVPMSLTEVTVVFVKFQGLEKLPFDRMNLALRCVQRAVYNNDGVLRQFLLDRMSGRRNLLQRIRSMQTKVQKLIQGKIIKNKSLDIKGMKRDIFEDFPPLGWKPSQLESMANKSLEDLLVND